MIVNVDLDKRKYDILIDRSILFQIGELVKKHLQGEKVFIISDENVFTYYGDIVIDSLEKEGIMVESFVLTPGEASKNLHNASLIYKELMKFHFSRKDLILTLGGGVVGDLGGFVSSTYLRGVDFIQVPTSLLAQIDSSVGGKVAVDLDGGKNLVGSFYQPKEVICDLITLETLRPQYVKDGLGEVIKYALIFSREFFDYLVSHKLNVANIGINREELLEIVQTCCTMKSKVVVADERESGIRALLNFGHTLGHAIEKTENFSGLGHGEAISIGMYVMSKISYNLGDLTKEELQEIESLLDYYELPKHLRESIYDDVLRNMRFDKKGKGSSIDIVLLKGIGQAYLKTVSFKELEQLIGDTYGK